VQRGYHGVERVLQAVARDHADRAQPEYAENHPPSDGFPCAFIEPLSGWDRANH
jgi:hypothetical protein